jgi:hypothetical protein
MVALSCQETGWEQQTFGRPRDLFPDGSHDFPIESGMHPHDNGKCLL